LLIFKNLTNNYIVSVKLELFIVDIKEGILFIYSYRLYQNT